jgi:hypothetical protein
MVMAFSVPHRSKAQLSIVFSLSDIVTVVSEEQSSNAACPMISKSFGKVKLHKLLHPVNPASFILVMPVACSQIYVM